MSAKKTNTRSQTQKYLSLGKFTLAPLCEPHKIEIVQEKRQETFVVIVVGRPFPCHKLLDLDESLSDKEHGVYVYRPIEVNGEVFDKTDIMCF